jgi:hypothetical protein
MGGEDHGNESTAAVTDKLIASEPTPGQIIRELHCWIATYSDGSEGIVAHGLEGIGLTVLLSSRRETAEAMETLARKAQDLSSNVIAVRLETYRKGTGDGD